MVTKNNTTSPVPAGGTVTTRAAGPSRHAYTPDELKTMMEAINLAPSWMSKRFIMQELLGWSEDTVKRNVQLKQEEDMQSQIGNKAGGYR
jgi:hypothetical protein